MKLDYQIEVQQQKIQNNGQAPILNGATESKSKKKVEGAEKKVGDKRSYQDASQGTQLAQRPVQAKQ